MQIRYTMYP